MSHCRTKAASGLGIGLGFFRRPVISRASLEGLSFLEFYLLSSLLIVDYKGLCTHDSAVQGVSVGYWSYTPANERTSWPTPSCHRSKGPPRELWPYQSYSASTILISVCGFVFQLKWNIKWKLLLIHMYDSVRIIQGSETHFKLVELSSARLLLFLFPVLVIVLAG